MSVDAETVLKLAPREWRPTIIAGFMIGAMVAAYFIFFAGPIAKAVAGEETNAKAITDQQRLNGQIERRLGAIEGAQNSTNLQLGAMQGALDRQEKNQDILLQFLLTGQRPKRQ